jgi:hypothetical protein
VAIVKLTLPDDLVEILQDEAAACQSTLDDSVSHRLHAAIDLDPRSRGFVVTGVDLSKLETALSGGSLTDSADLLTKVRRLASIRFGEHRLELTAGQMEEIARRARHEKKTVEQALGEIFKRMTQEFFRYV